MQDIEFLPWPMFGMGAKPAPELEHLNPIYIYPEPTIQYDYTRLLYWLMSGVWALAVSIMMLVLVLVVS